MRDLAMFAVYFGRLATWDWYDVCAHTFLGSSSALLLRDGAFSDGKDSQCMVCMVFPSSPPPDKARANFVRLEHVTLRWNHLFTLFLACHSYFQSIYISCIAGKLSGEAFHSLDWILFLFPHRRRSTRRLFRAKSDIDVTLWLHQYRLHLSATASRKGHFKENLFTYYGEAFHSSFHFLYHRAAVSLWMGIVWLWDIHCLLYEFNERTTEQRLIQAAFYSVSCVRFCFDFLFHGGDSQSESSSHADQSQTRSAITTFRPNRAPIRHLLVVLFDLHLELFICSPGNILFVYYLAFTNGGCAGMTILTQTCMIEHACCLRTKMDSAFTDWTISWSPIRRLSKNSCRRYHEHEDSWCQVRNLSSLLPAASRGGVEKGTAYVPTLPLRSSEPQRDIG